MDGSARIEGPERPSGAVLAGQRAGDEHVADEGAVVRQPAPQEPMAASADKSRLRGGGDTGAICCGICAGLCCFECLDCCCF